MKKIKTLTLATLFALYSQFSFAGIPVADGANLGQNIMDYVATAAEYAEQANRWQETVSQYTNQITKMTEQLESQTGIRDISQLVSDVKSIHGNLSTLKLPTADYIMSQGESFLDSASAKYLNTNRIYDRCRQRDIKLANLCKSKEIANATAQSQMDGVKKDLDRFLNELTMLQNRAKSTQDIKESSDIANAAMAKQAELEVIKSKIEIAKFNFDVAKSIREEQERQQDAMQNNNIDSIFPEY